MGDKRLYVAVGIPGSGKSYYFMSMNKYNHSYKRVSRDDIRFGIIKPDEKYFAHENVVYKEYIHQLQEAIDDDSIEWVCADATHLTKRSRAHLFKNLDLTKVDSIFILWHDVPLETAIERNEFRVGLRKVPESAIRNMAESLEPPTVDENPLIAAVIKINNE